MTTTTVEPGAVVTVRTAFGNEVRKRATTGVVMGADFLVVRVCSEEEWELAQAENRAPNTTPWPAEDVWPG